MGTATFLAGLALFTSSAWFDRHSHIHRDFESLANALGFAGALAIAAACGLWFG